MMDAKLILVEKKSLASSFTSDALDLGFVANLGAMPLYLCLVFPTVGTGSGTVTFNIQGSEDGSAFATKISSAAMVGSTLNKMVAIPLPIAKVKSLKLNTVVSGTVGGSVTAFVSDGFDLPVDAKFQGLEVVQPVA